MAEENDGQEKGAPGGACISLSEASPLSVADVAALSRAQRNLILGAAVKIADAERAAVLAAAAEKLKAEQHEQSREGRLERQAKAVAA